MRAGGYINSLPLATIPRIITAGNHEKNNTSDNIILLKMA